MRRLLLLTGIIISVFADSQSMLCLYKGGYFIRNGNSWYEYRPQSKDGVWSTYSQQSSDNNYNYVKNSACELSIPKNKKNSVWIKKGGEWEVLYTTIKIFDYCPKRSSHLFCFDNGFFIKNGTTWYLYMPEKEKKREWNTFTEYSKDDSYYYISNSQDKISIPRSPNNSFFLLDNGKWKEWHSALALYDAHSPKANSGYKYAASNSSSVSNSSSNNNISTSNNNNSNKIEPYIDCAYCNGTGKYMCTYCAGNGWKMESSFIMYVGYVMNKVTCRVCSGTGKSSFCIYCNSTGKRPNPNYISSGGSSIVGGGYNSSGSSGSSSSSSLCKYCGGGGGCSSCKGTGHKYNSYSMSEDKCPSCNGSGRCFNCRGTGRQR